MPKMKTHRGAAKRFKVTARGKLMRRQSMRNHLREKKSSTRLRRLGDEVPVTGAHTKKIRTLLGR